MRNKRALHGYSDGQMISVSESNLEIIEHSANNTYH